MQLYDVAIVGYGPTGLVAASLLGQLGRSVVVIERWPALYGLPRLTHIDDETARIVQVAGDVGTALTDSTPTEYVWVNGKDETLLVIPTFAGRQGYPAHLSIYQPDVEESIHQRVKAMAHVDLRQGWSLTNIEPTGDHVELRLARSRGHAVEAEHEDSVSARYVIASDGARSRVRELLGVERADLGFNETWLNVDVEWLREPDESYRVSKQFCDPARGHMFMGIGRHRERFEFAVLDGEDPEVVGSDESAWRLLEEYHGLGREQVRFQRRLTYTFEARIASQWRLGNVFLAGDAAHTTPPYLGQGACSGMRDGLNLAWKLGAVLDGRADDALLDTYQLEREPHVTILTHGAIELGKVANMTDPVAADHRDAAFRAGHTPPPPPMPPVFDGVVWDDQRADAVPIGTLTVQGHLERDGSAGRGDDVLGFGYKLISTIDVDGGLDETGRRVLERAAVTTAVLGRDVVDTDGVYTAYLAELGAVAMLVRPDFALFGIARDLGEVPDLMAAFARRAHVTV